MFERPGPKTHARAPHSESSLTRKEPSLGSLILQHGSKLGRVAVRTPTMVLTTWTSDLCRYRRTVPAWPSDTLVYHTRASIRVIRGSPADEHAVLIYSIRLAGPSGVYWQPSAVSIRVQIRECFLL